MSTLMGTPSLGTFSNEPNFENRVTCSECLHGFPANLIDLHTQTCIKAEGAKRSSADSSPPTTPSQSLQTSPMSEPQSPPRSMMQQTKPPLSPQSPTSQSNTERITLRSQTAKQQLLEEKENLYSMYTGQGISPAVPNLSAANSKPWIPLPPVPECPVYYPTEEEFKEPMKYISSVSHEAKKYGICRIVPPSDAWLQGKPFTKVVSSKNFIFQTKLQSIHQLQTRSGPNEQFLEELEEFLKKKNTPLKSIPIIDGHELDLYKLYHAVTSRGGLQQVILKKKWKEVGKELKLSADCTSAAHSLRQNYFKYLYQYELNQKAKKEHEMNGSKNSKEKETKSMIEEEEFGYHDGRMFTLAQFKKMANSFKSKWFPFDDNPPAAVIENAYWRIVENSEENVQVHYGSDLDVGTHGSGFPMQPEDLKNASGWNLNVFPKLSDSLLSHLDESTAGVSEPMMYIGMLFSTFCWHTEDNHLYSINYLHHGAPKTWYGIPDTSAEHFEEVMRKTVPELFKVHPNLLFLLITMISPRILAENKVPVYYTLQQAGEFMITFPKAYHAGFSHGFNCAESTNFALADWFPFGRESLERYRYYGRSSVLSFEKLLCQAAMNNHTEEVRLYLKEELPIMRRDEQWLREKVLIKEGTWKCLHFDNYEGKDMAVRECEVCKYDCYLSAVVCPCSPDKMVCLRHSDKLCKCAPGRKCLLFRWRLVDIDDMMKKVGCDMIDYKSDDMDVVVPKPCDYSIGRGLSGTSRLCLKKEKLSIGKPVIRKLARRAGVKKLKGIEYGKDKLNEAMFIIEKLVDQRTNNKGKLEYCLKWEGFPDSENTWESAENLYCPGLVEAFKNKGKNYVQIQPKRPIIRTHRGRNMPTHVSL